MKIASIVLALAAVGVFVAVVMMGREAPGRSYVWFDGFEDCTGATMCPSTPWTFTGSAGIDIGAGRPYYGRNEAQVWSRSGWSALTSQQIAPPGFINGHCTLSVELQGAPLGSNDSWVSVRDGRTLGLLKGAGDTGYSCDGSLEVSQIHLVGSGAACQGELDLGSSSYTHVAFDFVPASGTETFVVVLGTWGAGAGGGMQVDDVRLACPLAP